VAQETTVADKPDIRITTAMKPKDPGLGGDAQRRTSSSRTAT
jgi:hypothetical protein